MKHLSIILLCASVVVGCVEQSGKYKRLQAQLDSVQVVADVQNAEFEEIFATLNDIELGLKSIREAENILQIQSVQSGEISVSAREQMKNNIQYIAATLEEYKAKIERFELDNKNQSAQFQRRLKTISEELESKQQLIEELSRKLEETERQLTNKTLQITSMDQSIATLTADLTELEQEKQRQVTKIEEQDILIYSAFYIIGEKKDLITAQVLSKGGLFRSAKISNQAAQSAFTQIDIREITSIPLHAKKGKVLSIHPSGSYHLEPDANGLLHIHIDDPILFWEKTKYLIIRVN